MWSVEPVVTEKVDSASPVDRGVPGRRWSSPGRSRSGRVFAEPWRPRTFSDSEPAVGRKAAFRPLRELGVDGALLILAMAAPLLIFQVGRADLDVYRHGASVLIHGSSLYSPPFSAGTVAHLPFTSRRSQRLRLLCSYPFQRLWSASCGRSRRSWRSRGV